PGDRHVAGSRVRVIALSTVLRPGRVRVIERGTVLRPGRARVIARGTVLRPGARGLRGGGGRDWGGSAGDAGRTGEAGPRRSAEPLELAAALTTAGLVVVGLLDRQQDDGDVVEPAARVGLVDQRAADLVQAAARSEPVADLAVGEHAGQAVRAEQVEIAGLDL